MWYGTEVMPSFNCDIEVVLKDGKSDVISIKDGVFSYHYGNNVAKWRFLVEDSKKTVAEDVADTAIVKEQAVNTTKKDNELLKYKYTIKHLENENNYLQNEVRILKDRIVEELDN